VKPGRWLAAESGVSRSPNRLGSMLPWPTPRRGCGQVGSVRLGRCRLDLGSPAGFTEPGRLVGCSSVVPTSPWRQWPRDGWTRSTRCVSTCLAALLLATVRDKPAIDAAADLAYQVSPDRRTGRTSTSRIQAGHRRPPRASARDHVGPQAYR
jgi:hypothetical protein